MSEWWSEQAAIWIGSFGGAGIGVLGGVFGSVIGVCAPRGIGRNVILPAHTAMIMLGAAALVAGVVAVVLRQPYHVFYPLLLGGGLVTVLFGALLPVVRARYRQAEARRLEAEEIRRG